MKLQHKPMSYAAWYAEHHPASQHTIQPIEEWAGRKQDGMKTNGCQCAEDTMTRLMDETESPETDSQTQKEPPVLPKGTTREFVRCLICGQRVGTDEAIPLLVIEGAGAKVGMTCSIHRECFYEYDKRIHGELGLDVIVIE